MKSFFTQKLLKQTICALLALFALPNICLAHIGQLADHQSGLMEGILHPFTGLDHLTIFLTAGIILCITSKSKKNFFIIMSGLVIGILLGSFIGESEAFVVETAVALTILIAALLLFVKKAHPFIIYLLPIIACIHGLAHGMELPMNAAISFTIGSALSVVVIMSIGYLLTIPFKNSAIFKNSIVAALVAIFGVIIGTN